MKHPHKATVTVTQRVDPEGRYYLIVPDNCSGRSDRYTVYILGPSPSCDSLQARVRVIGRELPIGDARRVAAEHDGGLEPIYAYVVTKDGQVDTVHSNGPSADERAAHVGGVTLMTKVCVEGEYL